MSKYILGQAHQGCPVVSDYKLLNSADKKKDLIGYAIGLDSSGKVAKAVGTTQIIGIGVEKGNYFAGNEDNLSVCEAGQKILVHTEGLATVGLPVYVTPSGKFTSATKDGSDNPYQPYKGLFVGQDSIEDDEVLPLNTALINTVV